MRLLGEGLFRKAAWKKGRKELKTSHAANILSLISTGNFFLKKKKQRNKSQLKRWRTNWANIYNTNHNWNLTGTWRNTWLYAYSLPHNVDPPVDLHSLLSLSGLQPQNLCAFSICDCKQCGLHFNESGFKNLLGEFTAGKGPGKSSSHLYTTWNSITCSLEHKVVNAEGPVSPLVFNLHVLTPYLSLGSTASKDTLGDLLTFWHVQLTLCILTLCSCWVEAEGCFLEFDLSKPCIQTRSIPKTQLPIPTGSWQSIFFFLLRCKSKCRRLE